MTLFPAAMRRVTAVVLDTDVDRVTKELLREGVLHFVTISHTTGSWGAGLEALKPGVEEGRIAETRKRIESFLALSGTRPLPPEETAVEGLAPLDLETANKELDSLAGQLQEVRDRQRMVQQEILRTEEIRRQLELLGDLSTGLKDAGRLTFLTIRSGSLPTEHAGALAERLAAFPTVLLKLGEPDRVTRLLVVSLKRDDASVAAALEAAGWVEAELPADQPEAPTKVDGDIVAGLRDKLAGLHAEQKRLGESVATVAAGRKARLEHMWSQVRLNELYTRIQGYFSRTSRTVVFTGWLPRERERDLDRAVRAVTGDRCYIEWSAPRKLTPEEQRSIPVKLSQPKALRPFQRLVENYSIPQYGTIDPTPLVVIAYLLMFGLMFADVGQGAVIVLVGVLGVLRARREGKSPGMIVQLLCWCGSSSVVFGVLFGSYFGRPWLPPLWFDYHGAVTGEAHGGLVRDIYGILTITIYFGIAVIALGLVLNWVSLFRRRQWLKLVLDKGGLVGGMMYGAGVWAAGTFAATGFRELPPVEILLPLIGVPALLLLAKAPLEFALHGHGKHFGPMKIIDFLMEWIVEILEVFSGYLANTLSFMRVAGLGIGHVSLNLAFLEIANMLAGGGPWGIGSYAVYVVGNVLIIALEGLSAGVQSLRLNYYEFFTKYFVGDGKVYAPVSLRTAPN